MKSFLKRIATPEDFPTNRVAAVCYLAIAAIFLLDIKTSATIQLHLLYVFPLIFISLHCERTYLVNGAAIFSIALQIITLLSYGEMPILSKVILGLLVLPTNILVVYVSRFSREEHLEIRNLAAIDSLTKLNNRRSIESILNQEIERQKRYGGNSSFALLDLDGFKALNDTLGHHKGDEALTIVADVLTKGTRHTDTTGRLGGDEFVILMPNTQLDDCYSLCQQLALKIADRMKANSFNVTASIGCTTIEYAQGTATDVMINADKAMYAAKENNRGGVVRL